MNPVLKLIALAEEHDAKATKGPWRVCQYKPNQVERADGCSEAHNIAEADWNADAAAIAAARTAWPATARALKVAREALVYISRDRGDNGLEAAAAKGALTEIDRIAAETQKKEKPPGFPGGLPS